MPSSTAGTGGASGVSLREATRTWMRIGLLSFGGPAAQIAVMHRILVEEKRWVSEEQFLHALNFCMLLPGPEAQQLATYVGWLLHRVRGGLIAGLLFIAPGFFVILGLSYLYVGLGGLIVVEGLFLGLKAAVIAIMVQALLRIGRRSITSRRAQAIAIGAFLAMYGFDVPFPIVILVAAALGLTTAAGQRDARNGSPNVVDAAVGHTWRTVGLLAVLWSLAVVLPIVFLGRHHVLSEIAVFFSKMAVVTFGGAYAVLAYVAQQAVEVKAWLLPGEMIDGLAMAETTPGPLILVLQFVGFVAAYRSAEPLSPALAGLVGSILTLWVTFVPCFLWIFAGAPYVERLRQNRVLAHGLAAVTAAVVGVIMNLALWFAVHALFADVSVQRWGPIALDVPDPSSISIPILALTAIAAVMIFRLRSSMHLTLAVCGVLGMIAAVLAR
jgi:chromate transporter